MYATDSQEQSARRTLGVALWIGSIVVMLVWHPMMRLAILDEWLGRPARVPAVILLWPVLALISARLRRQQHLATAVLSVTLFTAIVVFFFLAVSTPST